MSYVRTVYRSPKPLQIIYPFVGNQRLANTRSNRTKYDILAKSGLKDFTDLSFVEGLLEIATGWRDTRILPADAPMPDGYVAGPGIDANLMRDLHTFKNNLVALKKRLQKSSSNPLPSSRNSSANHNLQIIHLRANSNRNPNRNVNVLQEQIGFTEIEDLHILEDLLALVTNRISWILPTTDPIPADYEAGPLIEAKYLRTWLKKMKEIQVGLRKYERDQTLLYFWRSIPLKPPPSRTRPARNSIIPSRATKKGNSRPVRLSVPKKKGNSKPNNANHPNLGLRIRV